MSLADVKDAIRKSVQAEADAVLEGARIEGVQIVANARGTVMQKRVAYEMETDRIMEALERKELANANTTRKAIILRAKRDAIDAAFMALGRVLDAMSEGERGAIVVKLATTSIEELGAVARVQCDTRDLRAFVAQFPNSSVLVDNAVQGGLIAQDPSGTVRIDLTYETILSRMHDEDITLIANILFGGEQA